MILESVLLQKLFKKILLIETMNKYARGEFFLKRHRNIGQSANRPGLLSDTAGHFPLGRQY